MRERLRLSAGAALAIGLMAAPALAQTQPYEQVMETPEWSANIGAGAVYGFSPFGDDPDQVNLMPWADLNWRDSVYLNPLDGLGHNIVNGERVRAGVQLRPRYSGQSEIDELDLPGLGADAAVYGFARIAGNVVAGGRVMRDVSGQTDSTSWQATVGHQGVTRLGLLQTTAYLRGGDGRASRAVYAVSAEAAAATGLPEFTPGGGPHGLGGALLLMTPIGENWGVATFANIERALGDAADSPLTRMSSNQEMAYRGGVFVVRRFGWP